MDEREMKPICAGPGCDLRGAFSISSRDTVVVAVVDREQIEVPEQEGSGLGG